MFFHGVQRIVAHLDGWALHNSTGGKISIVGLATVFQGGLIAACLVFRPMLPYLMNLARGYPYYPEDDNVGTLVIAGFTISSGLVHTFGWFASALLLGATVVFRDGSAEGLKLFHQGYSPVAQTEAPTSTSPVKQYVHQSPLPRNDVFNMFDPADLPPRLAEYANMVYSACEDLGNFFGFQDSSVRNQAEHLLILLSNNRRYMSSHILPPSVQPPSPIHALHAKVFSNYVKWCRAMGANPYFSKMNTSMNAPPAVASRVVDLVLYFCIWGESANLRHMSECIWFLYHRMMQEYVRSEGYTQTRSLYAGHFLDCVVTPIFLVVQKVSPRSMKREMDGLLTFLYLILYTEYEVES